MVDLVQPRGRKPTGRGAYLRKHIDHAKLKAYDEMCKKLGLTRSEMLGKLIDDELEAFNDK